MNKTLRTILIAGYHVFCIGLFLFGAIHVTRASIVMCSFGMSFRGTAIAQDSLVSRPSGCPKLFNDSGFQAEKTVGFFSIGSSVVFELLYWYIFRPWLVQKTAISVAKKVIGIITPILFGLLIVSIYIALYYLFGQKWIVGILGMQVLF